MSSPMNFVDLLHPSSALFLDFDGTLVDFALQPESVVVPPGLVGTLQALSDYLDGAVALISGRPIEQIDRYLHPLRLPVAGVHGAERRSGDGDVTLLAIHPLQIVERAAAALAARHPRLQVELKRGSLALHYRQAPELEALCLHTMEEAGGAECNSASDGSSDVGESHVYPTDSSNQIGTYSDSHICVSKITHR